MPTEASFDIVSQFDKQELVNALDQTRRELRTRFDFKDSPFEITLEEQQITILTESEMKLTAIKDVILSKLVRRQLPLKILRWGAPEDAAGGRYRQAVSLVRGLPADFSRQLTKYIRDRHQRVKVTIQGDAIRVTGRSRDDLQAVIHDLRSHEADYDIALQFVNYR
ncbi:MAG: YajQ family cyclic di-GMP-binding protein [Chloroflexi bacterium]|nr:YajQ family cyclic di-GMP-binding protein [Chloroflexota bacterium]